MVIINDEGGSWPQWWAVCETDGIAVVVERTPERKNDLPDPMDWEGTIDCPVCGDGLSFGDSELQTTWELKDALKARHRALRHKVLEATAILDWSTDGSDGSAVARVVELSRRMQVAENTLQEMHNGDLRKQHAQAHVAALREAMDARFEDGMPVLEWVFLANPDLRDRLAKSLSRSVGGPG